MNAMDNSSSKARDNVKKGSRNLFNPFPGLRPFTIEESHLFFGREGQSEEVLKNLAAERFVAVIGASGSGKSSLMYCGVVPVLYGGFITQAGSRWRIITSRPGNDPIRNLAESLAVSLKNNDRELSLPIILSTLKRDSLGLVDAIRQLEFDKDENILLMIDQFEELFRYRKSKDDPASFNESESFVRLLVEAVNQQEVPVYIVITMRSDFIGECSHYQEFTKLINKSNYLVPQMTREDFREAIEGPVAVGGGKINPQLVQLLLNEVGDNPDQLPILQHALMRTWDYWMQFDDPEKPISISDYEAIGKMEKALSEHANEAFEELSERGKLVCETMFKTLTEKGTDTIGIRHPTRIDVVSAISGSTTSEVMEVVETFRKPGRSFLTPAADRALDEKTVIDLSHESLMRIWNRLKIWVEEEYQAVQMYLRLTESSELFQLGKTGLWRPPDLQLALNWRDKQKPNLVWAERFNPAFERAMVYLGTSEKEYLAEEENKIRQQKLALRRTRIFALVLGSAAIVSLIFMLFAFIQRTEAEKQRVRAEEQTVEANKQRQEAETQRTKAQENEKKALDAQAEAVAQRDTADTQRRLAQNNEAKALTQEALAKQREREANEQRQLAETNATLARQQQTLAEKNAREAYQRRLLSIAQSMSVKSLQITDDPNLKTLLAYQAYQFNDQYNGEAHHNDIYSGLYASLHTLLGDTFNIYKGHTDAVNSVVFIPGTNQFITAGSDGKIFSWELGKYQNPNLVINTNVLNKSLAITRDGKLLACGTDGAGLVIYDLKGKAITMVNQTMHQGKIRALAFIPGTNLLLSTGLDQKLMLTDPSQDSSQVLMSNTSIQSLVVSEDGKTVYGGARDGSVMAYTFGRWNNPARILESKGDPVYSLALDQKTGLLAVGYNSGILQIWDLASRKIVVSLPGHSARVNDLKFSPDGTILASASLDGKILMFSVGDWTNPPIVLTDCNDYVFALAFSPDGRNLVSGSRGDYRVISRPTGSKYFISSICNLIKRNFTTEEWNVYVGEDIKYEATCPSLGIK
jgi:WD40 repeat protein